MIDLLLCYCRGPIGSGSCMCMCPIGFFAGETLECGVVEC